MKWIASLGACIAIAGCGGDYLHCHEICATKQQCVDNTLDVGRCAQDCADRADNDQSYARQVDACHACEADRACADDLQCAGDCAGVP